MTVPDPVYAPPQPLSEAAPTHPSQSKAPQRWSSYIAWLALFSTLLGGSATWHVIYGLEKFGDIEFAPRVLLPAIVQDFAPEQKTSALVEPRAQPQRLSHRSTVDQRSPLTTYHIFVEL